MAASWSRVYDKIHKDISHDKVKFPYVKTYKVLLSVTVIVVGLLYFWLI